MTNGALALLITGGTENWAPLRWRERFMRVCADRPVALIPEDAIDAASVRYAAAQSAYFAPGTASPQTAVADSYCAAVNR